MSRCEICKNCLHFMRANWVDMATSKKDGPQRGGHCGVLLAVLRIDNESLFFAENLYVQDTFGCNLFKKGCGG